MRPLRLNGSRALRLGVSAEPAQALPFEARRAATTSTTRSTAAPASKPPPPQSPYKRSATTSTTTSSNSTSAAKPSASPSPAAKNANTPFAESQTNPVPSAPYSRPQGVNAIPEAQTAFSQTANGGAGDPAFSGNGIDWSSSFHGLSTVPFSPEVAAVLMKPIPFEDVEIKPDGIIYLPEIKYRRILNQAFGPGGWGMAPRGELMVGEKVVTREYALLVHGR